MLFIFIKSSILDVQQLFQTLQISVKTFGSKCVYLSAANEDIRLVKR